MVVRAPRNYRGPPEKGTQPLITGTPPGLRVAKIAIGIGESAPGESDLDNHRIKDNDDFPL